MALLEADVNYKGGGGASFCSNVGNPEFSPKNVFKEAIAAILEQWLAVHA